MIEVDLYQALSSLAGGRVYPLYAPVDVVYPVIVYTVINTDPNNTSCGAAEDEEYRVQIDVYHRDHYEMLLLRKATIDAMDAAFAGGERITDFDGLVEDPKLYRRTIEYYL